MICAHAFFLIRVLLPLVALPPAFCIECIFVSSLLWQTQPVALDIFECALSAAFLVCLRVLCPQPLRCALFVSISKVVPYSRLS